MDQMLKSDFKLKYDTQSEEWYVKKVRDELTKNHRDMESIVSGIMPENKRDPLCPVQSFRKYISHLNPDNKFMWQYPLEKVDPQKLDIWFSKKKFGKNPLASFMSDVSQKCGLSQIYTNHSIRVIGCTVLTLCKFPNSAIMSVSGHKSVQSLAIYQKTKDKEKKQMGHALFQSMTRSEDQIDANRKKEISQPEKQALQAPPTVMAAQSESAVTLYVPPERNENINVPAIPFEANFDDDGVSDIDLLSALCGVSETTSTTVSNTSNMVNTAPRAMFVNCHIRAINITINKK